MDITDIRNHCAVKRGTWEDFPFNDTTLVFKVGSKMYALISIQASPLTINVKCSPDRAIFLRTMYQGVNEGYHMNKRHWNTITVDKVPEKELKEWIDHSYELVFNSLTKSERTAINSQISLIYKILT